MRGQITTVDGLKDYLNNHVLNKINLRIPSEVKRSKYFIHVYFENESYHKKVEVIPLQEEVLKIIDYDELNLRSKDLKIRFIKRYIRTYIYIVVKELLLDNVVYIGRNYLGIKLFTHVKYLSNEEGVFEEKRLYTQIIHPKSLLRTKTIRVNSSFKKRYYKLFRDLRYKYNYSKIEGK